MTRSRAIVVLMLVFSAALPLAAQNLVSPKLLPSLSSLHAMQSLNASLGQSSVPSTNQPAPRKHWTRGGKVMTFVGAGVAALGTALLVHGASNDQQMFAKDEKYTGAGMLAGGAVLTVIGLTRHSTD